jgi:hypothetical protein
MIYNPIKINGIEYLSAEYSIGILLNTCSVIDLLDVVTDATVDVGRVGTEGVGTTIFVDSTFVAIVGTGGCVFVAGGVAGGVAVAGVEFVVGSNPSIKTISVYFVLNIHLSKITNITIPKTTRIAITLFLTNLVISSSVGIIIYL